MTNQITFGTAVEIGANTLVIAVNTKMTVKIPKDYKVDISPELAAAGVTHLASGSITTKSTGIFQFIIVVDHEYREVKPRMWTKSLLASCLVDMKSEENAARLNVLLDRIKDDGVIAQVYNVFQKTENATAIRELCSKLVGQLIKIDWGTFSAEVTALVGKDVDTAVPVTTV